MIGTFRVGGLLILTIASISVAPSFVRDTAQSAESSDGRGPAARTSLDGTPERIDTVTVEAQRRRELERRISHFVSSFAVTYLNDSLQRWNAPICPLVAGLSKEGEEFILARFSQIARDAHAPLAPERCRPNLYVVVTRNPNLLVEKWTRRDRAMFNSCNGYGYVREFLLSQHPVRAFYNAALVSIDGAHRDLAALDVAGVRLDFALNACTSAGVAGSRLSYGAVQALSAVVIVVDGSRISRLNMGQLADYVSMVGLAQIRLDANTGSAPSILGLFRESDSPPQGLSLWDRSFLQGLYSTDQSSVLQVTAIRGRMIEQIVGR